MQQSKLIRLMKALTPDEVSELLRFSSSTFFNNGERPKKVELLLKYLAGCQSAYEGESVSKQVVFKAVFEGEAFNEKKLDKIASEAINVVRKFIVSIESDAFEGAKFWIYQASFFSERGLDNDFLSAIKQAEALLNGKAPQEEWYYFLQFKINKEIARFSAKKNDKKSDNNLSNTIRNLDLFYFISKLKYCSHILTQGNQYSIDSEASFFLLNKILDVIKGHFMQIPILETYHHAFDMMLRKEYNGPAYFQFKNAVKANEEKLLKQTLSIFNSYMRNYIGYQYNQGQDDSLVELHQLYKEHFNAGTVYVDEDKVPTSTIKSAINVALKLGEHEWAINLLKNHRYRIVGPEDSETIYQFNLANCYFHLGEFEKVGNILSQHNFKEAYYKLAAKRLEIKLLYETNSPLLDSRTDAFKIFVHEQKKLLPPEKISPNNHFVDLIRQIIAPKTFRNGERIGRLLEKLVALKGVAEREWLQQKLLALKKKSH